MDEPPIAKSHDFQQSVPSPFLYQDHHSQGRYSAQYQPEQAGISAHDPAPYILQQAKPALRIHIPHGQPPLAVNPHYEQNQDANLDLEQEQYFSYDSPRPMGPKQLPFDEYSDTSMLQLENDLGNVTQNTYNDLTDFENSFLNDQSFLNAPTSQPPQRSPNVSIDSGRMKYRTRKYQNLSQSGTSPFEVLEPYDVANDYSQHDLERGARGHDDSRALVGSDDYFGYTAPYPVNQDVYNSDDLREVIMPLNPAQNTPLRIPTLVDELQGKSELSPDYQFLRSGSRSLSSSPELAGYHKYGQYSSPLSSPPKSFSFRSPHTADAYSSYVHESRSSRSPSPRKRLGDNGSPSRTGFYPTQDILEDFYDDSDYRVPRWSLIEHDYRDQYEQELQTPLTNNFDYDNLPEIPRQEGDTPNRHTTFKLAVSLLKNEGLNLPSSPLIRRKNDALPPVPLNLPLLPFSSSLLTKLHFSVCKEVWSMKEIFAWCLQLTVWLHDQDVSHKEFRKALIKLVVFHRRQTPINLIGKNVTQIISSLSEAGVISIGPKSEGPEGPDLKELYVTFTANKEISGVLVDLTDCYCSDTDHLVLSKDKTLLKCYSSLCQINKMIEHEHLMQNTNIHDLVLGSDWANHWQLTAEDVNMDPAISKRQSLIFDLIKFEQNFIQRAECFIEIAAPQFINAATLLAGQSITLPSKLQEDICNPAKELATIHRTQLFEPLLRILIADGRLISNISGISELYEEWSKQARSALLQYMSIIPMVEEILRQEPLKAWDEPIRQNPRMKALQVNGNLLLMSTFNSRYQHLPLQLSDIRKSFDEQDEDYDHLTKAIESIKRLGKKVNEMKVHADNIHSLKVLERHLTWKLNIRQPNINLASEKRKFFFRGDLTRKGDLRINSHTVHLIVLDNYLLITEKSRSQRAFTFKVIEQPIPMDFLIIENREKETGLTSKVSTSPNLTKQQDPEEDLASFPFKIRYAGRGKYEAHTFFAPTEVIRNKWFGVFEKARSNLLRRVLPLAPYSLQLIDNSYFAYDQTSKITKLPILPINDPVFLSAAGTTTNLRVRGVPRDVYALDVPRNLVAYKKLQCSESFEFSRTKFHFLGLNNGVYCSDLKNRWKMIINMSNVTKISVVPQLNVVLVLASKCLRYYPLNLLIDIYYERKEKTSSFQLSNDSILFFEVGSHRGIPTLFVAKKKNAGTTNFKVFSIETDNDGIVSTFSVIKRFYIQADCYGISVFNTSVAVHTQRGFEILDLQKLAPRTVPELPAPEQNAKKIDAYGRKIGSQGVDVIRKAISHTTVKPMGMFKLANNKEFLLVYNECAIVVNKSGKLSRPTMLRFDFRPRSISFLDNNLFLVCEEVIEVWSVSDFVNGSSKLIQVIPSKDITMLNSQQVTFSMANPRVVGLQIAFELSPKPLEESIAKLSNGAQ